MKCKVVTYIVIAVINEHVLIIEDFFSLMYTMYGDPFLPS